MVEYKVKNLINPYALDSIKLDGSTKKLMDTFFYERIFSENAKEVIYKEAESAFETQADDETIIGIWQGEFWGKLIISACEVYKHTKSENLKDFLVKAAYKIMSYARDDGYIGTYKNSSYWFPPTKEDAKKIDGYGNVWNWNIWCRKYTLWGLLECYEISGDEKILDAAAAHANQLIDELNEHNVHIADTGTFVGMPSCSILKPMLILYKYTENQKFFDFATSIVDRWESEDNKSPNLITNALSKKDISDWYPDSWLWAKAYEMMSCYEGIIEYYRYSGDEKYLKASECFYDILIEYEQNIVGSVAYNDMFVGGAKEINGVSEPCDSIHFMRICYDLFALTGNSKYIDSFEYTFYNAFLAGVFKDGAWGARAVKSVGRHHFAESQANFIHNHCCVNNMPRAFMTMAECAVMNKENAVVINLYDILKIDAKDIKISISDGYFTKGEVNINISFTDETKDVLLRIPTWSKNSKITSGDNVYNAKPGYFTLTPTDKAVNIKVKFDITPEIVEFSKEIPNHASDSWIVRKWTFANSTSFTKEDIYLREKRSYITSGPLILCKSKLLGTCEKDIINPDILINENFKCSFKEKANSDVRVCKTLTLSDGKQSFDVDVCDYASAGNEKLSDDKYFSIYF